VKLGFGAGEGVEGVGSLGLLLAQLEEEGLGGEAWPGMGVGEEGGEVGDGEGRCS